MDMRAGAIPFVPLMLAFGAAWALRGLASTQEDPIALLLIMAALSFAVPRRFAWVCLAAWAIFWGLWAWWELGLWREDRNKFGQGWAVYGLGAAAFAMAAVAAYLRSPKAGINYFAKERRRSSRV